MSGATRIVVAIIAVAVWIGLVVAVYVYSESHSGWAETNAAIAGAFGLAGLIPILLRLRSPARQDREPGP